MSPTQIIVLKIKTKDTFWKWLTCTVQHNASTILNAWFAKLKSTPDKQRFFMRKPKFTRKIASCIQLLKNLPFWKNYWKPHKKTRKKGWKNNRIWYLGAVPSISFYPDFISILPWFYFIQIYSNFIQILSVFSQKIWIKLFFQLYPNLSRYCPNFSHIFLKLNLSKFYADFILILSG